MISAKESQQMLQHFIRNIPFSWVQQLLYNQALVDGMLLH